MKQVHMGWLALGIHPRHQCHAGNADCIDTKQHQNRSAHELQYNGRNPIEI
jgi:hypothetical protein